MAKSSGGAGRGGRDRVISGANSSSIGSALRNATVSTLSDGTVEYSASARLNRSQRSKLERIPGVSVRDTATQGFVYNWQKGNISYTARVNNRTGVVQISAADYTVPARRAK